MNLGYLDDITLGGSAKTVAADIREIIRAGAAIGLSLNVDKCELITHRDFQVNDALLQSFKRVELEDATLLGVPLFVGAALDSAWENRCEDLSTCDRLRLTGAQVDLILLISSFSAPKVLSLLLRCSPSPDHQALTNFDAILRRAIQQITNSNFSELQWFQASLPVHDGGLEIRRVSSLVLPAIAASAASTLSLQFDILSGCVSSDNNFLQSCLHAVLVGSVR